MLVKHLMTDEAHTCRPYDALSRAAQILWEHDCGCVPILDEDSKVVAMLTDRDICMAAYLQGGSLSDLEVSCAMSDGVLSCRPNDPIATAENHMRSNKVRRLPVIDDDGHLLGLLSLSDLAREASSEPKGKKGDRKTDPGEVCKTLAAICERRVLPTRRGGSAGVTSEAECPSQDAALFSTKTEK